jgi:hypothetical protein
MASSNYLSGRQKYQRPQGMLWANNSGRLVNGVYVPFGYEINSNATESFQQDLVNDFIILSDDNREPLSFDVNRIEKRERMINGRMRSYHIADKISVSTSWKMLPSRSFSSSPDFDIFSGESEISPSGTRQPGQDNSFKTLPNLTSQSQQFTTDGGAGGVEILSWYESHPGPFWVYLAYDKYTTHDSYEKLNSYNQVIEMYISDFSYSVQKRGGTNHDLWDISVTLEEV